MDNHHCTKFSIKLFYLRSCGFLEKEVVIDLYHGLDLFDPGNREDTQLVFISTPCLEMILVVSKIVMLMLPWTMATP